jgi:hypothetical protein
MRFFSDSRIGRIIIDDENHGVCFCRGFDVNYTD